MGIKEFILADTVHRFQGGEEAVIIFDCVEGPNTKRSKWSMLDDIECNFQAPYLLNVAITRAKCKVYLIANRNYMHSYYKGQSVINRLIQEIETNAISINSSHLMDDYSEAIRKKWEGESVSVLSKQYKKGNKGTDMVLKQDILT